MFLKFVSGKCLRTIWTVEGSLLANICEMIGEEVLAYDFGAEETFHDREHRLDLFKPI